MKMQYKIFIFGKPVEKDHPYFESFPHPKDKSKIVRFTKHPLNGDLYFNINDLLVPFGNKKYIRIVKGMVPRRFRNMERTWMNIKAWKDIKLGIDGGYAKEVIQGWKERDLF